MSTLPAPLLSSQPYLCVCECACEQCVCEGGCQDTGPNEMAMKVELYIGMHGVVL